MQSLKKHYDKIILSAVLLLLVIAAVKVPFEVKGAKDRLDEVRRNLVAGTPAAYEKQDVSSNKAVIARFAGPAARWSDDHSLFTSGLWIRNASGAPVKAAERESGLNGFGLTGINELKLTVSFERFNAALASTPTYNFRFQNSEVSPTARSIVLQRNSTATVAPFRLTLVDVAGPTESPTSFTIQLRGPNRPEQGETITVTPATPYEAVTGYTADLSYPPNVRLAGKKRLEIVTLPDRSEYQIVGIGSNEVTILERSSGKKRTLDRRRNP